MKRPVLCIYEHDFSLNNFLLTGIYEPAYGPITEYFIDYYASGCDGFSSFFLVKDFSDMHPGLFAEACSIVIRHNPDSCAVGYAYAGLHSKDPLDHPSIANDILRNLQYWKGPIADSIKRVLLIISKEFNMRLLEKKKHDLLTAEYTKWLSENGLSLGSADEHLFDPNLTNYQRKWLSDFLARWNA